MSQAERKLVGVLMQLFGAAIALGGITFISAAVATLIRVPTDAGSMTTLFAIVGVALFIGFAVIAQGAAMCTGPTAPTCPRCESVLGTAARCETCGWERLFAPPE